ncbi:DUF2939 domain-containing protein [Solilutibacter silvestris]|uniref:DUF2939 domain-containing protein n=1 Tax=Solilutibacter silvestris TaxID=1645665 RepID=A0A2K1PYP8_9GAMM|nr:DUF2939 domain-containing protein [Lysobacter silvestris]PNS07915.1 hypothetical protein Lysil_2091 [Lysobacter silvestris]
MTRTQRRISIITVVVLALLVAAWCSGPYIAMHGLRKAIADKDLAALETHVDFVALRASLSPQIEDRIARGISARLGSGANGGLAGQAAKVISDNAVNMMATPAGIGVLLQGDALYKQASGDTVGDGVVKQARPVDPFSNAHGRFESPTRYVATVTTSGGDVGFVFEPRGLRWKITNIRLPAPKHD